MTSKFNKKSLPRSIKELSKDQLSEILKKKRECNSRALRIVQTLIEQQVEEAWLLENLIHINQSHFDDVVTERSISQICGYPLCSNELGQVPKQQYRISLKQKAVYDITERKKYCSNDCFKSGEYLKNQVSTSPLWFRDSEKNTEFKLLPIKKDNIEVTSPTKMETATFGEDVNVSIDNLVNDKNYEQAEKPLRKDHSAERIVVTTASASSSSQTTEKEDNMGVVQKIEQVIDEWFTIKTLIHLLGEDAVRAKLKNNEAIFKEISESKIEMSRYDRKFEELTKVFSLLNLSFESNERELKPLPEYSALKAEAENIKIKVRAYYSGQYVVDANETKMEVEESGGGLKEDPYEMPLVDSHAQTALRRRVLLSKLNRVVPDVCLSLEIPGLISVSDIRELVCTFTLSSHNVTLKPQEGYLIALVLIKLMSLKLPSVKTCLMKTEQMKRTTLLLLSYNLPSNYLDNLVEWLSDPEHLMQKLGI